MNPTGRKVLLVYVNDDEPKEGAGLILMQIVLGILGWAVLLYLVVNQTA